jgi:GT2 family glycosyltransferase
MDGQSGMPERGTMAATGPHGAVPEPATSPDVDIIILSLDRVDDTIAAIDSALTQRGVRQRIWVVDQGSGPETIERLQQHVGDKPAVHLEVAGRNLGVPGGRNVATRLGRAPYVVSLDNDAVFRSDDEVARAVQRLEADPSLGAIGFRILNFYTNVDDEWSWGYPPALKDRSDQEFLTTRFIGAGHALRRSAFESVGGYDDSIFFYLEEFDVAYGLINRGYRILYVPQVVVLHKVSPERRVDWKGGNRFYYLVRNRIYIEHKYGASIPRLALVAAAYFLRGSYNGMGGQAVRGIWHAIGMCRRYNRAHRDRAVLRLSAEAHRYIFDNDGRYRGSLWRRLWFEVFIKVPGMG